MYLDLHVLQTLPANNANRDETGSPKKVELGGTTRAMVSSQAWKRAIRLSFENDSQNADWTNGLRTVHLPKLLSKTIQDLDNSISEDDALKLAIKALKTVKIGTTQAKNSNEIVTNALVMMSKPEIKSVAQYIVDHQDDKFNKKDLENIINNDKSVDLALFGRMVAANNILSVDGSSQIAPAMSTNAITPEFDFYAAVDDAQTDGEEGAANLGDTEFNSSTLYRYGNLNLNQFAKTLGNDDVTIPAIKLFIKEFITSMPTGYQNRYANRTLPSYILAILRPDQPVNLADAYDSPIVSDHGYMKPSIMRLNKQFYNKSKLVESPILVKTLTTEDFDEDQIQNLNKQYNKHSINLLQTQADNITDLINDLAQNIKEGLN